MAGVATKPDGRAAPEPGAVADERGRDIKAAGGAGGVGRRQNLDRTFENDMVMYTGFGMNLRRFISLLLTHPCHCDSVLRCMEAIGCENSRPGAICARRLPCLNIHGLT